MKDYKFDPVDKKNKIPYYIQIKKQILKAIYNNVFNIGERLEGENALSKQFGVGRLKANHKRIRIGRFS